MPMVRVDTDTLILTQPADAAQIRVTLGGTNDARPALKFLGVSFSNTKVSPAIRPPNPAAWGKIIPTPERSQHGYPNEKRLVQPDLAFNGSGALGGNLEPPGNEPHRAGGGGGGL